MRTAAVRYFVMIGVLVVAFGLMFVRMYSMQVVDAETYTEEARKNTQKTLRLYGIDRKSVV